MTNTDLHQPQPPAPSGYWRDHKGHLVGIGMISPLDQTRTDLVDRMTLRAKALHGEMAAFKRDAFSEITAFLELAASEYETTLGGVKGNLTLRSFDGLREIKVQVADRLTFDERLKVAEKLVGECVADWAAGARPELKTIVDRAFATDKEGNVSTTAVLSLRRLAIEDERWQRAMKAISDSVVETGTSRYVRFYERETPDAVARAIVLDLAKL